VICASDGLQFLTNAQIERVVTKYRKARSTEIAERLLEELVKLDDPDQDNISFTVIKVNDATSRPKTITLPRPTMAVARPKRMTTVIQDPGLVPLPQAVPAPQPAVLPTAAAAEPVADDPAKVEPARPVVSTPSEVERTPRPTPHPGLNTSAEPRGEAVENLSPVRLRPRRVIVIK
jgi:hypothetical protein